MPGPEDSQLDSGRAQDWNEVGRFSSGWFRGGGTMEITRRGFFKVTGIGTTIALETPAAAEPLRFATGL